MNKVLNSIFSMRLIVVALFLFFIAIGWATFVENDFGTPIAQKWIYKSTWFSVILVYLSLGMINNLFRYKLFQFKKLGSLTFHVAFLVIMTGAAITRYYGFEGVMQISEGTSSNVIISSDTYLQIKVDDQNQQYTWDAPLILDTNDVEIYDKANWLYQGMAWLYRNQFYHVIDFPGQSQEIEIEYLELIKNVKDTVIPEKDGTPYLEIVTVGQGGRQYNYLESGKVLQDAGFKMAFNNMEHEDAITIFETDSGIFVRSPVDFPYLQMSDQSQGMVLKDTIQEFLTRRLYTVNNTQFVFSNYFPGGRLETISSVVPTGGFHGVKVRVTQGEHTKEVVLKGGKGIQPNVVLFTMGDLNYRLAWGSKLVELPFYLYLRDFQLDRYPGTNNPSSYASEVTLVDPEAGLEEEHRIFMNNVLDYAGYRFFQSSYDPSERGTILSVNHDAAGTNITYLGYLLLGLGFIINLFSKGSRFHLLLKKSRELRKKREALGTLLLLIGLGIGSFSHAQNTGDAIVDYDHAEKFGRLVVQDFQGRYAPVQTLAVDFLKKVHRSTTYDGQSAMQVFLGIHTYIVDPSAKDWAQEPLVYVSGDEIREELNIDGKYAAIYDFFTPDLEYVLQDEVEQAHRKKPALRNEHDKNLLKTDERFNHLLGLFNGVYFRIFPKPGDPNHTWYTPYTDELPFAKEDKEFVESTMQMYFGGMIKGYRDGDWQLANKAVDLIDLYQRKIEDPELMPSKSKIELEILYNKVDIFKQLNYLYLLIGLFILIFEFITLFAPRLKFKKILFSLSIVFLLLFVLHGVGLGVRWYLSGHAPWSNGYEASVFIAFITVLGGISFSRGNKIVLGATGILAWLMLFVAHMSNMDPQLTNLVPVLKSYWLQIHVSIITGSYGFLGLGAILGLIILCINIFLSESNQKQVKLMTKELTYVSEMTITFGLFMLTVGTFLGGVWANESWGRYWGWDAKETWALASVLIYGVVLHLRFIPGLKGQFTFNFVSLWAYGSIIMTFFGVNFYLSGLHSYATGDPIPIPLWVPITILLLAVLSAVSYLRYRRFYMLEPKKEGKEEE